MVISLLFPFLVGHYGVRTQMDIRLAAKAIGHNATERISGIYILTNQQNGKVYIGKSQDIFGRWRHHLAQLRSGHHVNPHLQSAWKKYGEDAFNFRILEYVSDIGSLGAREMWHVKSFKSTDEAQGYNLNEVTPESFRASEETRLKLSIAQKKAWARNKEARVQAMLDSGQIENLRQLNIGRRTDAATRLKQSVAHKGKHQSEQHKKAKGDAHRGWVPSAETRVKIGLAHLGLKMSPEAKTKMSASRQGHCWSPCRRAAYEKKFGTNKGDE